MGNWKRVAIEGTCDSEDVPALREALIMGDDNFHCLVCTTSICGLPNWAAEEIKALGNLAERGYNEHCIAEALEDLAKVAPSLAVRVHVGSDNEGDACIATVGIRGGKAHIVPPEVMLISRLDQETLRNNLSLALTARYHG